MTFPKNGRISVAQQFDLVDQLFLIASRKHHAVHAVGKVVNHQAKGAAFAAVKLQAETSQPVSGQTPQSGLCNGRILDMLEVKDSDVACTARRDGNCRIKKSRRSERDNAKFIHNILNLIKRCCVQWPNNGPVPRGRT